jgi:glycosyltransferase involved in cell wall biosynthesis
MMSHDSRGASLSVLMFCPQFRPAVGGAERQAEKLSVALVARGVRVTVLTPRLDPDSESYEEQQGVVIHRFRLVDLCRSFPKLRGLGPLNLLAIGAQTRRALKTHLGNANIVHAHIASPLTAFAMQAARMRGIPVLCKVAVGGARTDLGDLSRVGLGGRCLASAMVRGIDTWVATTEGVRESLLHWGVDARRVQSIPNGVAEPRARRERPGPARRFLYLGRISSNSNRDLATLVRAFDRAADEVPAIELNIVGDGDLFAQLAAVVKGTRNKDRIRMPGFQEAGPCLHWADCFVLPSRYEGLSNALLEAMASRLACVANDIAANREVLADGSAGFLVPVGDENALCAVLIRLSTEQGLAAQMGTAAFDRMQARYSIESVAGRYMELYKHMIDRHLEQSS